METLKVNTIGSTGAGARLLILLHGYGADEYDLAPIAPMIDPTGRFFAVAPRAPLDIVPFGAGWYERGAGRQIDPDVFHATVARLDATIDAVCAEHGLDRETSVVIGFSQGGAMALASSLRVGAPVRPAAVACLSGMMNQVEGLEYALEEYLPPILIQHGTHDPMVDVARGREICDACIVNGVEHHYREYPMGHEIVPESIVDLRSWLSEV
ncbi:MAG: dienelactone hydrolase family protein [Actinomycetota bacterium]